MRLINQEEVGSLGLLHNVELLDKNVAKGKQIASTKNVVFCGLTRDSAKYIAEAVATIHEMGKAFKSHSVTIFENDSTDGTQDVLKTLDVDAVCKTFGHRKFGSYVHSERINNMAMYRDEQKKHLEANYQNTDYVIILDLDMEWLYYDGCLTDFAFGDFDFMGSNCKISRMNKLIYYDFYSTKLLGDDISKHTGAYAHDLMPLKAGELPIQVKSCFGGFGVYKSSSYLDPDIRYSGEYCEHAVVKRQMLEKGYDKIFLNPSSLTKHG